MGGDDMVGNPEGIETQRFRAAGEITQPARVAVLRLTLDEGGEKNAELHLVHLLAAPRSGIAVPWNSVSALLGRAAMVWPPPMECQRRDPRASRCDVEQTPRWGRRSCLARFPALRRRTADPAAVTTILVRAYMGAAGTISRDVRGRTGAQAVNQ